MSKSCTLCGHWVTCKWWEQVDALNEILSVPYGKAHSFGEWRRSFAEFCDYYQSSAPRARIEEE